MQEEVVTFIHQGQQKWELGHQQTISLRFMGPFWYLPRSHHLPIGWSSDAALKLQFFPYKSNSRGTWGAQSVKHLPLAQVMISGSWDWAPREAPCPMGCLLLPLSAHALVLCLSQINRILKTTTKKTFFPTKKVIMCQTMQEKSADTATCTRIYPDFFWIGGSCGGPKTHFYCLPKETT